MSGENCVFTLFRRADGINCIIDDELEVLVQQSVDQRGAGYAFSICQRRTNVYLSTIIAIVLRLYSAAKRFSDRLPE